MGVASAGIRADFLEDQDIPSMFFEPHRVGFHISQDAIEVVLVDPQKLAAIFSCNYCRRSEWYKQTLTAAEQKK